MKRFVDFLNEKLRDLNTEELFRWLEERQNHTFVALDTETTGLRGPRQEQLTQISAVAFTFNFQSLKFTEVNSFNEKIKLTPDILSQKELPGSRIKDVFKYTRYGVSGGKFIQEQEALERLFNFVNQFDDVVLLIQNAPFDMPMINIRSRIGGLKNEIFDTKDFFAYFLLPTLQVMAENDEEAKSILDIIGTSSSGKLPTSSLPKVSKGLGIDPGQAHDALFDCRYMVQTLEKALEIVNSNRNIERKPYLIPRISMDRYIKMKNKMNTSTLR